MADASFTKPYIVISQLCIEDNDVTKSETGSSIAALQQLQRVQERQKQSHHRNRHVSLHQPDRLYWNRATHGGVMTSYRFSRWQPNLRGLWKQRTHRWCYLIDEFWGDCCSPAYTQYTVVFLFHLLSTISKPFSSLSTRLAHAARLGFFYKNALNSLLLLLLLHILPNVQAKETR